MQFCTMPKDLWPSYYTGMAIEILQAVVLAYSVRFPYYNIILTHILYDKVISLLCIFSLKRIFIRHIIGLGFFSYRSWYDDGYIIKTLN